MDPLRRAVELAEENDLHVACVTVRGEVPDEVRPRLLAEAAAETRAVLDAEGWAVWWAEQDEDAALFVLNGLAQDVKAALVALEDEHALGGWFNLDLVTALEDGNAGVWHASPMRLRERELPRPRSLDEVLVDYDWS